MSKNPKYKGEFKDRRGEGITHYHPWAIAQSSNPISERVEWVDMIIDHIEDQGSENPSKRKMAEYLRNKNACHIIGFAPYVEYVKHKAEGGMGTDAAYVHAFGSPALLVFDKKSKSLLIVGPGIDFNPENGIRG